MSSRVGLLVRVGIEGLLFQLYGLKRRRGCSRVILVGPTVGAEIRGASSVVVVSIKVMLLIRRHFVEIQEKNESDRLLFQRVRER